MALMSIGRAIGAAGAGIPMLMVAEYGPRAKGLDGRPSNLITNTFLYTSITLLTLSLLLSLLINPYPIVKEPKDPTDSAV